MRTSLSVLNLAVILVLWECAATDDQSVGVQPGEDPESTGKITITVEPASKTDDQVITPTESAVKTPEKGDVPSVNEANQDTNSSSSLNTGKEERVVDPEKETKTSMEDICPDKPGCKVETKLTGGETSTITQTVTADSHPSQSPSQAEQIGTALVESQAESRGPEEPSKLKDRRKGTKSTHEADASSEVHVDGLHAQPPGSEAQHKPNAEVRKVHHKVGIVNGNLEPASQPLATGDLTKPSGNLGDTSISDPIQSNTIVTPSVQPQTLDDAKSARTSQIHTSRDTAQPKKAVTAIKTSPQLTAPANTKCDATTQSKTKTRADSEVDIPPTTHMTEDDASQSNTKKTITASATPNTVSNTLLLYHSVDKTDGSLCSSSLFALAALATLAVAAAAPAH